MALGAILTLAGNLTHDPELRFTKANKAVVSFTIAQTSSTYDQVAKKFVDGETTFLRCSAWDDLAEHIAHSLSKGDRVIASGQLKTRKWTDKEGAEKSSLDLVIDDIGPSLRKANARPVKGTHAEQRPKPVEDGSDGWTVVDDETPF
jgi:single-strand DNA-binding protein